jgi:hypothetical protein
MPPLVLLRISTVMWMLEEAPGAKAVLRLQAAWLGPQTQAQGGCTPGSTIVPEPGVSMKLTFGAGTALWLVTLIVNSQR